MTRTRLQTIKYVAELGLRQAKDKCADCNKVKGGGEIMGSCFALEMVINDNYQQTDTY